ncbi:MAG: DegV family protein [Candidatus Humimicrobiaceae bacterium]
MDNIAIVTDSSSDIPKELVEKYGIKIIPMYINFGDHNYKEGEEITVEKVFGALKSGLKVRTSCPSVGDFVKLFEEIFKDKKYDKIYYIGLGSKLSSSINSANIAKSYFPEGRVKIIDSNNTTISLGLIIIEFSKLLKKGVRGKELDNYLNFLIKKYTFFAAIENFEYVFKSGRTPFLANFLSKAIIFKPVVSINSKGRIYLKKFVKNKNNSILELFKQSKSKMNYNHEWNVGIFYGQDKQPANKLVDLFKNDKNIKVNQLLVTKITTIISAHTGPGVWGVAFGPSINLA